MQANVLLVHDWVDVTSWLQIVLYLQVKGVCISASGTRWINWVRLAEQRSWSWILFRVETSGCVLSLTSYVQRRSWFSARMCNQERAEYSSAYKRIWHSQILVHHVSQRWKNEASACNKTINWTSESHLLASQMYSLFAVSRRWAADTDPYSNIVWYNKCIL